MEKALHRSAPLTSAPILVGSSVYASKFCKVGINLKFRFLGCSLHSRQSQLFTNRHFLEKVFQTVLGSRDEAENESLTTLGWRACNCIFYTISPCLLQVHDCNYAV